VEEREGLKGSNNRTKKSSFRSTRVEGKVREEFLSSLWKKREYVFKRE
jgi:hypothetical protein